MMINGPVPIITARKRSLGQGNIFTPVCHSVHRGACVVAQGCGCSGGACMVAPGGHEWLLQGGMHVVALRGVCGCSGGHVWLLWGACMGAPRECAWWLWGACIVAPGGHVWLLLGGVHGIR